MHTDLKQRIDAMRARLDGRAPVTEIHVSSQLFVTPDPVCQQLTELAAIEDADVVLEPSAGTGAILKAVRHASSTVVCDAVEQNAALACQLRDNFPDVNVTCCDFLQYQTDTRYSKIIMNPPFQHAQDIKHVLKALTQLKPGGVLVAICLSGPRQEKALKQLCEVWEPLPRGTFTYTDVGTVMLKITA
jgi:phospholipid N-methyltransferase